MAVDLKATELYTNRELSWLAFDERVLALALRDDVPLLERLKFIGITASNLDEFFMVRVGGLERFRRNGEREFEPGPDGLSLTEILDAVWRQGTALRRRISAALYDVVLPELAQRGVHLVGRAQVDEALMDRLRGYYRAEVHPCLTPIAVDRTHPFPSLKNGSLNLAVQVHPQTDPNSMMMAVVQLPSLLPRFIRLAGDEPGYRFMALEDVIALFVEELFVGHVVVEATTFRVTRASDIDIADHETDDLLSTIEHRLRQRDRGEPVQLSIDETASAEVEERLRIALELDSSQVQRVRGLLGPAGLLAVLGQLQLPDLKDDPFTPADNPRLQYAPTVFRSIQEQDILLHHPYESFRHVVEFLEQAAADPDVVAIKQTLYRTSGDSAIVRALQQAAEAGKEVTALVELKARFDEANNISWAKQLEESGAHVVYGLIGFKTHTKLLLVIRREGDQLKRYAHLATGNYHPKTAGLYTDLGLLTARDDLTHDAMVLFNVLTGYAELPTMRRLVVAPFTMRARILDHIEREIAHARAGRPAGLRAKMNSLVDGQIIEALYRASQAGVPIELIVRGICCLRPRVPGVSENIRVRSILDRFLEHARVFHWRNGGDDEVYLSSADWMPRNLNKRIEVSFPILDPDHKKRVVEEILGTEWADNEFSWTLGPDGGYTARSPGDETPVRAQLSFMALATAPDDAPRTVVRPEIATRQRMSPAVRAAHAQLRRLG